jgi:hypothetical protein
VCIRWCVTPHASVVPGRSGITMACRTRRFDPGFRRSSLIRGAGVSTFLKDYGVPEFGTLRDSMEVLAARCAVRKTPQHDYDVPESGTFRAARLIGKRLNGPGSSDCWTIRDHPGLQLSLMSALASSFLCCFSSSVRKRSSPFASRILMREYDSSLARFCLPIRQLSALILSSSA